MISYFIEYNSYYLIGIFNTLALTILSIIPAFFIGVMFALMKMSKNFILKIISNTYIEIIRGTPLLLQILIIYNLPYVLFGFNIPAFFSVVITVTLNSSAYIAEIVRSGIQSVDKGQVEAGRSLGLVEKDIFIRIVLPQSIKNILPALGNEFITIIKETSVAMVVGVLELTKQSNTVFVMTYTLKTLIISGICYFIMTFTLSNIIKSLEKRMK